MTFTCAIEVESGDAPTSRQQRSLARAINDRLRGNTDSAWRVAWGTYNAARLVRNPDSSGWIFPAEHEFWSLYAHLDPGSYEWPITGPGEPEGSNLGSVLPQFVFGNPALFDEAERLSELFPLRVNGQVPVTAADRWDLGKLQRGAITADGAYQYVPAFEAAQTVFRFAFHPLIYHGKSYGGWLPGPALDGTYPYCDVSGDYQYWPNRIFFWTGLSADVSTADLHGTITTNGDGLPVVTYAGSCPCGSGYTGAGHVLWLGRYPFAWYLAVSDGTTDAEGNCGYDVDRIPTNEWVEGPYDGAPYLAHTDAGHILRAVTQYHSEFRGADSQRTPDTFAIQRIAFDNQSFFTRQYPLAPAYGIGSAAGLTAIYPSATFTSNGTAQLTGESGPWTPHDGFVVCGYHARATSLPTDAVVTLKDGLGTTLATLRLSPIEGEASASSWADSTQPGALYATVSGILGPDAEVAVEAAEILEYKPQVWDAYLVSRMTTGAGDV